MTITSFSLNPLTSPQFLFYQIYSPRMMKSTLEAIFTKMGKMHPILKPVFETKKDPRRLQWIRYKVRKGKSLELLRFVQEAWPWGDSGQGLNDSNPCLVVDSGYHRIIIFCIVLPFLLILSPTGLRQGHWGKKQRVTETQLYSFYRNVCSLFPDHFKICCLTMKTTFSSAFLG